MVPNNPFFSYSMFFLSLHGASLSPWDRATTALKAPNVCYGIRFLGECAGAVRSEAQGCSQVRWGTPGQHSAGW